eukprot:1142345-Amphidinium_carterae.1
MIGFAKLEACSRNIPDFLSRQKRETWSTLLERLQLQTSIAKCRSGDGVAMYEVQGLLVAGSVK